MGWTSGSKGSSVSEQCNRLGTGWQGIVPTFEDSKLKVEAKLKSKRGSAKGSSLTPRVSRVV